MLSMEKVSHNKKNEITMLKSRKGILYVIKQRSSLFFFFKCVIIWLQNIILKGFHDRVSIFWKKCSSRNLSYLTSGQAYWNNNNLDSKVYLLGKIKHSKGTHQQNEKAPYKMEKLFANHVSDNGLISKIYKKLIQFNSKTQTIQFKNGQKILIDIFLKRTYR